MFPTVVHQGNRLAVLPDAVHRQPRAATLFTTFAGTGLHDGDVVDRLPVAVVDLQRIPVRRQAGRDMQPVRFQPQAEEGFDDEPVQPAEPVYQLQPPRPVWGATA